MYSKFKISLRTKLLFSFILVSLIPLAIISFVTRNDMDQALISHDFASLKTISNFKAVELKYLFNDFKKNIKTLAELNYVTDAIKGLNNAKIDAEKHGFYGRGLLKYKRYKDVFDKYYSSLKRYVNIYGFYDIFLFSAQKGDVLFTIALEEDFGSIMSNTKTHLAKTWEKMQLDKKITFSDFETYSISNNKSAMFLLCPVYEKDIFIGSIGLQLPDKVIDEVIHAKNEFGHTGKSYLVGQDFKMRSHIEDKKEVPFTKEFGVLKRNQIKAALSGKSGKGLIKNDQDKIVLSVFRSFKFGSITWALMTEIELEEIQSPIFFMEYEILFIILIVGILVILFSIKLAKSFSEPLVNLTLNAQKIAKGIFDENIDVRTSDEIGDLAHSFKIMINNINLVTDEVALLAKESLYGNFYQKADEFKFPGNYRELIKNINNLSFGMTDYLDNLPIGFMIINKDFKILFMNRQAKEMLGNIKVNVQNTFCGDLLKTFICGTEKCVCKMLDRDRKSIQSVTKANHNGVVRNLRLFANTLVNESEEVIGFMETIVDETEIRKLEEEKLFSEKERNELYQIMQKTLHLTALSGLTAGIAHEINQPLTALKVMSESILFFEESGQPQNRDVLIEKFYFMVSQIERIDQILIHMRSLVSNTYDQSLNHSTNINNAIKNALDLLTEQLLKNKIEIILNLNTSESMVNCSETHIEQIVINLITNSIKAFDIKKKYSKIIVIETKNEDDKIKLIISDNGRGIKEEILDKIFDPFVTTDSSNESMGLGLFIVYNIVKKLNGSIYAYNSKGARFELFIPFFKQV